MSEPLRVCRALAAAVSHFGEPNEEQIRFIGHAAFDLGLGPEENEQVKRELEAPEDYHALLRGITSRPMQQFLFRRLVALALLDKRMSEEETTLVDATAHAFGYAQEEVAAYLAWMREGAAWEARGAEILARLGGG